MHNPCPKCQTKNPITANFCMNCGYNIQTLICNRCDTKNKIDASFCFTCGNVLQSEEKKQHEHILTAKSYALLKLNPPDDVKKRVGYTWFHNSDTYSYPSSGYNWLTYLHGIQNDDGMALEPGVGSVHLQAHDLGLLIHIQTNKNHWVGLSYSEIEEITIEKGENAQKDDRIVGGALIGGILLGPIGAVLGGLSKAGSKTVATSLLVIKYKLDNKNDGMLIFAMEHGCKQGAHDFLKKRLSKYYNITKKEDFKITKELKDEVDFCYHCGAANPKRLKYCPECEKKL